MDMKLSPIVRKPDFDWSAGLSGPRLDCNIFSYGFVASSLIIVAFESFIVRVTKRLLEEDAIRDPKVRLDAERLVGQELAHAKQHRSLNQELKALGYGGFDEEYKKIADTFSEYFRDESLRFCTAYCAAFELSGLLFCDFYFHHPYFANKTSPGNELLTDVWYWHFAEEYEHRSVAFDVYKDVYGAPATSSYFYRLNVMRKVLVQFSGWSKGLAKAMAAHDRATLSAAEADSFDMQYKRGSAHWKKFSMKKVWPLFSPTYKPENVVWPEIDRYLADHAAAWVPKEPDPLS